MKVHVSDAVRLGCSANSVLLNLPTQIRSALALKSILISAINLIDLNLEIKINQLCEHAGVSIGTFYVYFKNIDHLKRYLHFLHLKECEETLTNISKLDLNSDMKILLGTEAIYNIHSTNRSLHHLFKLEIEDKHFSDKIIKELKKSIINNNTKENLSAISIENTLRYVKPWVENDSTYFLGLEVLKENLIRQ